MAQPGNAQHEAAATALGRRGDFPSLVPKVLYEFWVRATRPSQANGLDPAWFGTWIGKVELDCIAPPTYTFATGRRDAGHFRRLADAGCFTERPCCSVIVSVVFMALCPATHSDGAAGFSDENLRTLSEAFTDSSEHGP
jgi:hypothetical protein